MLYYVLELEGSHSLLRGESQPKAIQHMHETQANITWMEHGWKSKGPVNETDPPYFTIWSIPALTLMVAERILPKLSFSLKTWLKDHLLDARRLKSEFWQSCSF